MIGMFWSNCCDTNNMYKPSDLCDAEALHVRAKKAALARKLEDFVIIRDKTI